MRMKKKNLKLLEIHLLKTKRFTKIQLDKEIITRTFKIKIFRQMKHKIDYLWKAKVGLQI